MSRLRRIVNNSLISLFGQAVTWASTLLLTAAYGRFLGDVKFGELYFAITFVALIGFPVESGFNQQITRDVAEDPKKAHAYLWNTLLIKVTLWALLYGIILLLAWALGYDQEQRSIVAVCGITLMSGSIVNTFAGLHYAFERALFPSVGLVLEKGLSACVGFILLKYGATAQTMAFVLLGGSLIDVMWVALWFFRLEGWHVVIDKTIIHKLLHTSIPFIVYGVLGVIYYRIDTIMLSLMTNTEVVGWYGAGYRLFDTLLFIPNLILGAVMYPVFSKLSVSSQSALKMAVEKCMNLLLICVTPIAALMIVSAPNIIGFLYRADFVNTNPVLQALAPGLVFLYINTLFFNIILSTRGERKIPILAGAALVFNLGLNLFLIPRYQQVGAALVTSLTELLLLCISFTLVPKHLLPAGSLKVGGKVLIATLCMALAAFLLQTFTILVIAPVALVVYAGVATLIGTIPREDVQALYKAFKSKGKGTSTEIPANAVDEDIYDLDTQHLPAMMDTPCLPTTLNTQFLSSMLDTQQLPAMTMRGVQPKGDVELEEVEEDDDITLRLPVLKVGKVRRVQLVVRAELEEMEE
jgi:O-antigen/teichoic acid export membrane protein